jgi:hypothetical protein
MHQQFRLFFPEKTDDVYRRYGDDISGCFVSQADVMQTDDIRLKPDDKVDLRHLTVSV